MITTYFKNLVANSLWSDATVNMPTEYYVALSSTEPKTDGTGVTEPTGADSYERQKIGTMSEAVDGSTSNTISIGWKRFGTDQGAIGFWALYDAQTNGNLLMGGALDSVKHLDAGTTILFEPGSFVIDVLGV